MLEAITDYTPVHKEEEDQWGWGKTGEYTVKQGYFQMQGKKEPQHPESVWKQIWENFSIPKINFFSWTLFHNKILTRDNLCKRNIASPHRCALCKNALETSVHLFIDCEYAQKVWNNFFTRLNVRPPSRCQITEMFLSWKTRYPHNINEKSLWHKLWIVAPKYVCWKLWLSRNESIFNQKDINAEAVARQAKDLLLETLRQTSVKDSTLRNEEKAWLEGSSSMPITLAIIRPIHKENWQFRDSSDNFQNWWKSQGKCTIFFDGASKGNPGRSGAGGVIYFQNGRKEEFSWGLGIKTNNQAEALSLLKACHLARKGNANEIIVFGDSELLIRSLINKKGLKDPALNKQLARVNRFMKEFSTTQLFHILRDLNTEADRLANVGCILEKSMISINAGALKMATIP